MKVSPVLSSSTIWKPLACTSPASKNLAAPISLAKSATILMAAGWRQRGPLPDLVADGRGLEARALVGRPLRLLGGAGGEPVALVGGSLGGLELRREPLGDGRDVARQRRRAVVVRGVGEIAVDVDDVLRLLVADAGAVGLAHRARADDDQQLGFGHGVVAADGALRAADVHVLRMRIRQHAGRAGRQHHGGAGRFGKPAHARRRGRACRRRP